MFLRFPGQWDDEVWLEATRGSEVYYNVHRWYQPATGRYGRPDPLGSNGEPHAFLYARANPTVLADALGLFCTSDFVKHYFTGGGSAVDLDAVGLLPNFRQAVSVRRSVRAFKKLLFKKMVQEIRQVCHNCTTTKAGAVSASDRDPVDVTNEPCLFAVGNTTLRRSGACSFQGDCPARTFSFSCSFSFGTQDRFENPADIFDLFPGGIEIPGAKPYDIRARWTETNAGSSNF